jgi:Arc/MetJ-type ribon-helix-helix transcriptional regulator
MKTRLGIKEKRLTIRLKEADFKRLEAVCVRQDINHSDAIREALETWLAENMAAGGAKKSAVEMLEADPANHHFTAQALADQAAMEADIAAKKKAPKRR